MSWRTQKICYLCLVGFSLSIAVGFALLGFWPILPFAGAELVALGAGFYICALNAKRQQTITIEADRVAVKDSGGKPTIEKNFQRPWTRVQLVPPRDGTWYPSRLTLGSHGKRIEVGQFLNEQERRLLAKELNRVIVRPVYPIE